MSKISNTPPKEGDELVSAAMNTLFSDFVAATSTAMQEDNIANESIDVTQLNLTAANGENSFILKKMRSDGIGTASPGVVVATKTATGAQTWDVVNGAISYGAAGVSFETGDFIRVYYNLVTTLMGYGADFPNPMNWVNANGNVCWAVWLEYAASWDGGTSLPTGWTEVPQQGDFRTDLGSFGGVNYYGTALTSMRSAAIVPHLMTYLNGTPASPGTAPRIDTSRQNFHGQYYYTFPGNTTWYGMRLRIGGLLWAFNTAGNNYLAYIPGYNAGNTITYEQGEITLIQMRSV